MMRKIYFNSIRIFLIFAVFLGIVFTPVEVHAKTETLGDLKNELTALKNKKAKQDNEKKKTQSEINANKAKAEAAAIEMDKAKLEIANLREEIAKNDEEIAKLKEDTESILTYYQELENENIFASFITGASSMTDLVMRLDLINELTDYNESELNKLELYIKQNEKLNKELENYQVKLDEKIDAYNAAADELGDELTKLEEGALTIQDQINVLQEKVKYYEGIGCKPNQTLIECDGATANNSGWLRPVSKGRITSLYGYRVKPTAGASSNHKGIDIGIKEGSKVYATANGKVEAIVWKSSCGGNMVYISTYVKGKPYTYVFMHMLEIHVKVGQKVTVNDVVGLSGGGSTAKKNGGYDRCTTGAHLHYGLAEGHYVSKFNSHTINPPGYPGLYQWFYTR